MTTLTRILLASFLLTTFALSGCATLTSDITVETETYPDVDFSRYKTYAWLGGGEIVYDPIGQWEQPTLDTDEEVRFLVNRELRKHGLTPVTKNPDLFIAYAAGVDMTALELKENPETKRHALTNVPRAALLIAMVDARSGYLVWLGYATGNVQKQQSIDNIRKRIDYAVTQIFRSFDTSPPAKEETEEDSKE